MCFLVSLVSFTEVEAVLVKQLLNSIHRNPNFLNLQGIRGGIWGVWIMFGLLYLKPHPIRKERNCIWFELSEILAKNGSGNQDTTSILITTDSFYLVLFSLTWNIATAVEIISRMCWGNAIILRASIIAISEKTAHWTSTAASSHGNNIRMTVLRWSEYCTWKSNVTPLISNIHLSVSSVKWHGETPRTPWSNIALLMP